MRNSGMLTCMDAWEMYRIYRYQSCIMQMKQNSSFDRKLYYTLDRIHKCDEWIRIRIYMVY